MDGDGDAGPPVSLRDLLGHQGEVHDAQPFVVQGGRAVDPKDKAGLIDRDAGDHLQGGEVSLFIVEKDDSWQLEWNNTFHIYSSSTGNIVFKLYIFKIKTQ
jgi:hypothetical protein